jgi:hypothetical protein
VQTHEKAARSCSREIPTRRSLFESSSPKPRLTIRASVTRHIIRRQPIVYERMPDQTMTKITPGVIELFVIRHNGGDWRVLTL